MIFKAPEDISIFERSKYCLFLAGSIEMGMAIMWQDVVTCELSYKYNIFNPRRDDWDSSWKQDVSNPHFLEQVNWELDSLDEADIILFYFDPNTKSPISLLELGLYVESSKQIYVVCPKDFYRKGNVDIICLRNGVPVFETLEEVITILKEEE